MGWWPSNWFGLGAGAFADTVWPGGDRANVRYWIPPDSRLYLTRWTRRELNNKYEWLWQNFGIVKEGLAGTARHVMGKGISLQIDSEDPKWNQASEDDFENYALTPGRCDLAGRRNLYEAQGTAIEQRLGRGEFFAALTENPFWNNEPCFQIYDSEEIGTPVPRPAPVNGEVILDGVALDKNSRAVRYYLRGMKGLYGAPPDLQAGSDFTPIDAARMIHWYKPHAVNQSRGITDFAQAVNPLVDIHELKKLATRSAKAQQLLALALKGVKKTRKKGAFGAIENAGVKDDGTTDPDTSQTEKMIGAAGGGIIYLDDINGDAKLVTANSPSPLVEGFITDLLMRDVCAGWGVPSEFFWNMAKMNGGNTRFILARADLFFQILGDRLIDRFCTPIAFRYLSHRINIGALPQPSDKNWALKLSWQLPPRVTVDNGRENQILIELLGNGLITMREYCNARGYNYKSVMRQWIREPIEFLRIAEEEGAPPEMLQMWKNNPPVWRASKPGAVQAPGQDPAANQQVTAVDENGDPLPAAA